MSSDSINASSSVSNNIPLDTQNKIQQLTEQATKQQTLVQNNQRDEKSTPTQKQVFDLDNVQRNALKADAIIQQQERGSKTDISMQLDDIQESLQTINQLIPIKHTNLIFEFDDISEPPIIKVVDKESQEVIREIPPKNIQHIAKALKEMAEKLDYSGALFNSKV